MGSVNNRQLDVNDKRMASTAVNASLGHEIGTGVLARWDQASRTQSPSRLSQA